jgi:hypothetical protein
MNPTLFRALLLFVFAAILFVWSLASFLKKRAAFTLIQLLGAGFLLIVVLTHFCEALSLFPSMHWGSPHSFGHYVDLGSAVLGLILFPAGLLLRLQKRGAH